MCQEDAQASCQSVTFLNKHIHPFVISNPKYHCYIYELCDPVTLFEQKFVKIFSLIPVRKVPYQNFFSKQHTVLQMWMRLVQYD